MANPSDFISKQLGVLLGTRTGLRRQLVQGAVGSAFLKVAQSFLGLVLAVLLARLLLPEGYGVYSYALALVTLLAIPANLGLPTLLVREVARYRATRRWDLLRGLVRRTNQAVLLVSVAVAAGAAFWAWLFRNQLSEVEVSTFFWALLLLPLTALGRLRGGALRGFRYVVTGQLPETLFQPGLLLVFVGLALLFAGRTVLTPASVMALHVLAALAAFLGGAVILLKVLPRPTHKEPVAYETKRWIVSLAPLSFLAGTQVIINQTDIIMLGMFTGAREIGIYRVTVQGAGLVVFTLTAVNRVIAPYVTSLYTAGKQARLQEMITRSAQVIIVTALPVALVFILLGNVVLRLIFGEAFEAGHSALAILSVGQLFNAGMGSVGLVLNMTGHEKETAKGLAIAAVLNVTLNGLLIPFYGMNGAAIATATTLFCWNILLVRMLYLKTGLRTTAWSRL